MSELSAVHPLLYEINTRCWLAELSEHAGRQLTLAEIPDSEFIFWRHNGFTHIWLMGVWALGARGRAWSKKSFSGREEEYRCRDIAGSPYAITAYQVSRRLGGNAALAKFRQKLKQRGIKLILDFIPNHTALDHPWVKTHPDFYVTSEKPRNGTVKPYRGAAKWFAHGHCGHGLPWVDTLQLEHRNPRLRRAMISQLRSVAGKCDGVRCDMAMLMVNDVFARTWSDFPCAHAPSEAEFWEEAIDNVRIEYRDFVFLAEVYWDLEARLQKLGFDFTYDKRLYDRIVAHDAVGVASYLQSLTPDFLNRSAHFLENHDEPRIAALLSQAEQRAAALLILTLPGMRFLHEGQMQGSRTHANVHFARRVLEEADRGVSDFYDRLLRVLPQTAVARGKWKLIPLLEVWNGNTTHRNIIVLQWQCERATFDLAVINLAPQASQCYAVLDVPEIAASDWRLRDLLGDGIHERSGRDLADRGLYLDLSAHGAQLFHCESIQR